MMHIKNTTLRSYKLYFYGLCSCDVKGIVIGQHLLYNFRSMMKTTKLLVEVVELSTRQGTYHLGRHLVKLAGVVTLVIPPLYLPC